MMIEIRYQNESNLTSTFKLDASQACIIGRSEGCAIKLISPKVSGKHIRIRYSQSNYGWTVEDLDSTNGTYINGRKIKKTALITKDCVVQLGRSGPSLSLCVSRSLIIQPKAISAKLDNISVPKIQSDFAVKEWKPLAIIGESVILLAVSVAIGFVFKELALSTPTQSVTTTNQESKILPDDI